MKRDDLEKKLSAYFDELGKRFAEAAPPSQPSANGQHETERAAGLLAEADPVVAELIRSFLMWDAPRAGVKAAEDKLEQLFVDANEMRIALPEELAGCLGSRYPACDERCARIRSALHEVFIRENGLALAHLRDQPKRAARAYLDSIPGMTPFVAARVALVCCEAHAFPVDRVLLGLLHDAGAADDAESADDVASRLERAVRAGDATGCYARLELAAMDPPKRKKTPATKRPQSKKPAGKKSGAKKSAAKRAGKTR